MDLALNNQQRLVCHITKPNQTAMKIKQLIKSIAVYST